MSALLTIGEFSRLTHLSVKALRHYDDVGLLEPAHVDPSSGYRRYATAQVPVAHVIRRFRDLDMPLEQIQAVLEAPDVGARDRVIVAHLERMEQMLEETQVTVASLRRLLEGGETTLPIEYRSVPVTPAIAVRARIHWDDAEGWLSAALEDLHRALVTAASAPDGPDAALYSPEFFERHLGEVIAFVPVTGAMAVVGRVEVVDIPATEYAVTVHQGPFADLDQAYGALGSFVSERVLGADGPILERYLAADANTDDAAGLRTEVCWPIRYIPPEEPGRGR
jgi:DNA-binding transcriptional MerR regulator/effector-binding domain-containing protein